jgi:molybdopterin/thiamine biosynthesis adenylyltransferase
LEGLLRSGRVIAVHETLGKQLEELITTRNAARKLSPTALAEAITEHLGGRPVENYGTWVYYPWSRRVVHLLPEAEFRELRTSRNRNKITIEEQERLRSLKLAIAGLSVGRATAVTLALEEIGGHFRLADFDALELSNLNRLRGGVHELGINKSVLTARELFEINPYLDVEIFTEGVTSENLSRFLSGPKGGSPVDLLFEECDDLAMKVNLRERARALGIPVLMETSDRGMLDVERFDQDPERPLFHGLAGDLDASRLAGLSTHQKVPIVLDILGPTRLSPRMAASLIDIDATLKTWPQLASAVALGGALNTEAARRIVLGQLKGSGRFYVDPETLIQDGKSIDTPASAMPPKPEQAAPSVPLPLELPTIRLAPSPPERPDIEALVARAALAPSGGNCQPWRFCWRGDRLECWQDPERSRSMLDFGHRATYLAFGAALENLVRASRFAGMFADLEILPDPTRPLLVATVRLRKGEPPTPGEVERLANLEYRVTNRRLGARSALTGDERNRLSAAAERRGALLHLLTKPRDLNAVAGVLAAGDRVRFLSQALHREMFGELRWSADEVRGTRDGIDIRTLELDDTDHAGLRLTSDWRVMSTVADVGGGAGLERSTRKAVGAAAAIGLLTIQDGGDTSYVKGGRAVQEAWCEATAMKLAFQPMSALVYLFQRNEQGRGAGLSDVERKRLTSLRRRFDALFPRPADHTELLVFRLGRASTPSARSLRRGLPEILSFEPDQKEDV